MPSLGTSRLIDRYPYTGPAKTYPVTLAEAKDHLQVFHTADDIIIGDQIVPAATELVEATGHVSLIQQKREAYFSCPSDRQFILPRPPAMNLQSFEYVKTDGTRAAVGLFTQSLVGPYPTLRVDDIPSDITDTPIAFVAVYEAGYGSSATAVPSAWKQAVLAVAAHLYDRRELIDGTGSDIQFEKALQRIVRKAGTVVRGF